MFLFFFFPVSDWMCWKGMGSVHRIRMGWAVGLVGASEVPFSVRRSVDESTYLIFNFFKGGKMVNSEARERVR